MGRQPRPRPRPAIRSQSQPPEPPHPPPGPAGVRTGRTQRATPPGWLVDMVMIINGIGRAATERPPRSVNQVQVSGDGSVSIQSGGNITISASNGSVAAWSIDNLNALTLAPGNGPSAQPVEIDIEPWIGQTSTEVDSKHRADYSWRASTRYLLGAAALLTLHTGLFALALTVLLTGGAGTVTYWSLALNPAAMALHAYRLRGGMQRRLAERNAYNPRCRCDLCTKQPPAVAAQDLQPKPLPIDTWDTRPFTASCDCPRCGAIATHHLRAPGDDDTAFGDGVVIRTCTTCGQEWTER